MPSPCFCLGPVLCCAPQATAALQQQEHKLLRELSSVQEAQQRVRVAAEEQRLRGDMQRQLDALESGLQVGSVAAMQLYSCCT